MHAHLTLLDYVKYEKGNASFPQMRDPFEMFESFFGADGGGLFGARGGGMRGINDMFQSPIFSQAFGAGE